MAVQADGGAPGTAAVGVASLIVWSLLLVVSIKYALLIMRADNGGEGGVVAMLYGDGAITPAFSVLSAVEGLRLDAPRLSPFMPPITVAILIGLFVVQAKGTG